MFWLPLLFVITIQNKAYCQQQEVNETSTADYSNYNIAPPPDFPPPEILEDEILEPFLSDGCGTIYVNDTLYRCMVNDGNYVSIYPMTVQIAQWVFDKDVCINKLLNIKGWQNVSEMCVQDVSREVEAWSWKTENNSTDWVKVKCLIPNGFKLRYSYTIPVCYNCYDMFNSNMTANESISMNNVTINQAEIGGEMKEEANGEESLADQNRDEDDIA